MNISADVMTSKRCPSVAKGGPRNSSSHFPTMQASLIINNQRMRQSIKLRNYNIYFGEKHGKFKSSISELGQSC